MRFPQLEIGAFCQGAKTYALVHAGNPTLLAICAVEADGARGEVPCKRVSREHLLCAVPVPALGTEDQFRQIHCPQTYTATLARTLRDGW